MKGFWKPGGKIRRARFNARGRSRVFTTPRQTHWIFRGRRSYSKLEKKAGFEKSSHLPTRCRIMPGIHIDCEWSMQSSSIRAPGGETQLDAWIHDSFQNESEKNTRAQEGRGEITGEQWWISELNSIINHSEKRRGEWEKNKRGANKLNNNCISFPHQKIQSVQPWTD